MHVSVVSPERVLFEGEADAVVAPAFDGLVGILPRHAPFLTLLGDGRLTVRHGGQDQVFVVSQGFLRVLADRVRIVADRAEAA
jgi:F-type H+-transporting ATPase subunit epsilon